MQAPLGIGHKLSTKGGFGSDSEKLAMSTMGPLCPEQLTREETLDEVCVGPTTDISGWKK
jgi:hypothetical protein